MYKINNSDKENHDEIETENVQGFGDSVAWS